MEDYKAVNEYVFVKEEAAVSQRACVCVREREQETIRALTKTQAGGRAAEIAGGGGVGSRTPPQPRLDPTRPDRRTGPSHPIHLTGRTRS